MQKVIFENDIDAAISLLNGGSTSAAYFGNINYYKTKDLLDWCADTDITIEKIVGVRTFYALHPNNEIRFDSSW